MEKKFPFLKLGAILLIGILFVLNTNAQEQVRTINGIVTDSSGTGIPGVTVKIKNSLLGGGNYCRRRPLHD